MQQEPNTNWTYSPDKSPSVPIQEPYSNQADTPSSNTAQQPESISWTGSEFMENYKNPMWFAVLGGVILLISAIIYLISKDIISIIFVVVMGILFAVMATRKPRQLQYYIDAQGIWIGQKSYLFTDYKSFSYHHHGAIGYVNLLPLHRLHNELSIYFPPDLENQILNILSEYLPNEQRKEDLMDRFTKLIRF
mgnify:CR=1 FL=1